jgi:lariat debranching enzyme
MRTEDDLQFLSCPDKYKEMGQFHLYYKTKLTAPYLTIFIGGNHEASNVLNDHYYGGWICENIFYLGRAGVINYKGLKIAGISGIYKPNDYYKGHYEKDLIKDIKSIFHVREFEICKLAHLTPLTIDIIMSHDWPTGNVNKKDFKDILSVKKHWREELQSDTLGSPASGYLLKLLKPRIWMSGHMHYTYINDIVHTDGSVTK